MQVFQKRPHLAAALGSVLFIPSVQAHIHAPVTIEFESIPSFFTGQANVSPLAGGVCPSFGGTNCYFEDGVVIGIVKDTEESGAHLHRADQDSSAATDYSVQYGADTSGIYIRAEDGHEFGLFSMHFTTPSSKNPDDGANDFWEILGFNTAYNDSLSLGDGTNYGSRIAYQTVDNNFDGTVTLDHTFHEVNAVWIHYKGYPSTPLDGKAFELQLDDLVIGAAEPSPVPVPALGLWGFGAGLAALTRVVARKRR